MRAFCLESGDAIHQGVVKFKADLPGAIANNENDLTPVMRRPLSDLFEDRERLLGDKALQVETQATSYG